MPLEAAARRHDLPLADAFTIARGTTETVGIHVVEVADEAGRVGYGAAAPSAYYGEDPESVAAALPDLLGVLTDVDDPHAQQRIGRRLRAAAPDQAAARAAVSVAAHDLAARQREEPLYRRWGLDPEGAPRTSYTVGISDPETMAGRAADIVERGFPILKVKLGTDDDRARLEAVRDAAPAATIRVDANGAWTATEAVDALDWLADCDVELLEQPVGADDVDGLSMVRGASSIPIAADESCVTARDVPAVAGAVDVVVVKLMKCGGPRGAISQIAAARAHGLDTMLGCMVESDASIAAAAHLAPLVEYADLDGSLLLAEDPYTGVELAGGAIHLGGFASAGTGVEPAG
jgi:L-alanine-DL-glutamate epimerase-like enolase superfamily enzyme